MEDVGQFLRQTRESRGITLEDAAQATKIRQTYLEAIEKGDWSALPPAVYARGFIRSYAEFLGLDGSEILRRAGLEQPAAVQPQTEPRKNEPARVRGWERYRPALPQILASVGLLAVLATGYWLLKERDGGPTPPVAQPENPAASPYPSSPGLTTEPPRTPEPPAPALKVVKKNASQFTAEIGPVNQVEVSLKVQDKPCWVDAQADGQSVERRILEPGEVRTFRGDQEVRIIAGRASSLRITVNGRELDPVTTDVFTYTIKKSAS
ncbi:MAG: helix-turn-helix domain-containing protein [Alicyclobacillaceae bacterium]|nr:helix-turn-helix domain-containing protein [Alicyclobacillaceae bacterium]